MVNYIKHILSHTPIILKIVYYTANIAQGENTKSLISLNLTNLWHETNNSPAI